MDGGTGVRASPAGTGGGLPPGVSMSFDEALWRMLQRQDWYLRGEGPQAILEESALVDAAELWAAVQPLDSECPTPEDDARLKEACSALGWFFYLRCAEPPGDAADMARAVLCFKPLEDDPGAIPEPLQSLLGASAEPEQQAGIGYHLTTLAQKGSAADRDLIDAGIGLQASAVSATQVGHPDLPTRLHLLGISYHERHERYGAPADLDQAVELAARAVEATPDDHPDRALHFYNLATVHLRRWSCGGPAKDLDQAVELGEQAVAATSVGDPHTAMRMANLAAAAKHRFTRDGLLPDLDRAIEMNERALEFVPERDPDGAVVRANLVRAYRDRFERTKAPADLSSAIHISRDLRADFPDRPDLWGGVAFS